MKERKQKPATKTTSLRPDQLAGLNQETAHLRTPSKNILLSRIRETGGRIKPTRCNLCSIEPINCPYVSSDVKACPEE